MTAEILLKFFEKMALNPEKFIEGMLNIAKEKAKEETDGSGKTV